MGTIGVMVMPLRTTGMITVSPTGSVTLAVNVSPTVVSPDVEVGDVAEFDSLHPPIARANQMIRTSGVETESSWFECSW
jgi:hypothetical protein